MTKVRLASKQFVKVATILCLACSSSFVEAETYRTHLMRQAESRLENYGPAIETIENGRGICWLGTLSGWDEFIVQMASSGMQNGFLPADQIVAINGAEVVDGATRSILVQYVPGDSLTVAVARDGRQIELDATCHDGTARTKAFIDMLTAAADGRWHECMEHADLADEIGGVPIAFTANFREKCSEAIRCSPFRCSAPSRETARLLFEYRDLAIRATTLVGRFEQQRPYVVSSIEWLRKNRFTEFAERLEAKLTDADAQRQGN